MARQSGIPDVTAWLIGQARVELTPPQIATQLCERLVQSGVPISRVRIAQLMSNPLILGWGLSWRRGLQAEDYTVPRTLKLTDAYLGSPFEHVMTTRRCFRRRLLQLVPGRDHPVLFEIAAEGGTDYMAIPIEYGDGSVQVAAFTTDRTGGYSDEDIRTLQSLGPSLSAALEPASMRRSAKSLLETYLGAGPARSVIDGAFERGTVTHTEAVLLLTDLRGFTALAEELPPEVVLTELGNYFEVVVEAVRSSGGDVLKFIGDGVLSMFAIGHEGRGPACLRALQAVRQAANRASESAVRPFVSALHVGEVIYGNIGSPDRLDFTVLGPTVNLASRLEAVAKSAGPHVCSAAVAEHLPPSEVETIGEYEVRGVAGAQRVYRLSADTTLG